MKKTLFFLLLLPLSALAGLSGGEIESLRAFAEEGRPEAQHRLGMAYYEGDGVEKDIAAAARWFRLSAQAGDAASQMMLGRILCCGQGKVAKEMVEGHMWLLTADALGNPGARQCIFLSEQEMTPEELAEARRRADEWLARHHGVSR